MTTDAKIILEKLRNIAVISDEHYKTPSPVSTKLNALEILNRIKTRASGEVTQTSKTSFSFNVGKRIDIAKWLEEKEILYNTDYSYVTINFETEELAVEFKLRFMGI